MATIFVPPLHANVSGVVNGVSGQSVQTLAPDGKTVVTSLVDTPTRITVAVTDSAATPQAVATLTVEVPPKAPITFARFAVRDALAGLRHQLELAGQIQGVTPPTDTDLTPLVGHTESA